ncbi:hypothetical protein CS063_06860 [Sporanaerobium hydrogeniformans]|uniref:Uncharacterized protein n=1 Tax=Sporanaerobium hydrogeniformans TaxID=3072179 RepID=A0AC61DCP2_9FIRM|nr:DUF896 domain-containing protein [Sporanaerobium hydrogeniformans]PHV71049.1 hypothetical protein CS063_06860 [Sporanaerobium hydrogeniformans]
MEMNKLIARINELARKQKDEGLTTLEQEEQANLRQEYLAIFRGNFKNQLKNTKIQTPDGKLHPLTYRPSDKQVKH